MERQEVVDRDLPRSDKEQEEEDGHEHHRQITLLLPRQQVGGGGDKVLDQINLGYEHGDEGGQYHQAHAEAGHDENGTYTLDGDHDDERCLMAHPQHTRKEGVLIIKVRNLPDAERQHHDTDEEPEEQAPEIGIGVSGGPHVEVEYRIDES